MLETPQDIERDIVAKRDDMISAIHQLRGTVREKLDLQRQVRARPGAALGIIGGLALLFGLALGRGWRQRPVIIYRRPSPNLRDRAQDLGRRLLALAQG